MKIACFADDPGGANGIIALVAVHQNCVVCAMGAAKTYFAQHGIEILNTMNFEEVDALVVGATSQPRSKSYDYIVKAREERVKSFAYIDACVNAEKRFRGDTDHPLYYAPDYLLVTEAETQDAFVRLGFDPDKIFIVGNPRYDFVVHRVQHSIRPVNNPPKVLFLADPVKPIGEGYQFNGLNVRSSNDIREHVLLDMLLGLERVKACDVMIKLHPRSNYGEFSEYMPRCEIYEGDDLGIDLVYQSDLIVGTATSLLVEAALVGVPSISVLLAEKERAWLPHLLPDTLQITRNRDDFESKINQALDRKGALELPSNQNFLRRNSDQKMLRVIREMTTD